MGSHRTDKRRRLLFRVLLRKHMRFLSTNLVGA